MTLTARKEYNIWDSGANNITYYELTLNSPLIEYKFQEIRIGLEWASRDTPNFNERVIFYGTVGDGAFLQHRIDENYDSNGRLFVPNYEVVSIPKYHHYLTEELTSQNLIKYKIDIPEDIASEMNIRNGVAKVQFSVERDEPYGSSQVWLNWGIFDSVEEESTWKVYGSDDPFMYENQLTWNDYFDRPLLLYGLFIIGLSALFGIFAAPISFFPILILELYVILVPVGVLLFANISDSMTLIDYLITVVIRFQLVMQISIAVMALSNSLPLILLF